MASATLQKVQPIITREVIPPKTCVGILHRGPYNQIGDCFKKLYGQLHSSSSSDGPPKDCTTLGLYLDDPQTVKAEDLRSYAAIDVTSFLAHAAENDKKGWWPADWETIKVGGGPAAVMTVTGSYDQLGPAWQSFEGRVNEMGWKLSEDPDNVCQEVYLEMDEKDASKNVTKLIMILDEE
jgi:DNA gyrase inhibitor GyrI